MPTYAVGSRRGLRPQENDGEPLGSLPFRALSPQGFALKAKSLRFYDRPDPSQRESAQTGRKVPARRRIRAARPMSWLDARSKADGAPFHSLTHALGWCGRNASPPRITDDNSSAVPPQTVSASAPRVRRMPACASGDAECDVTVGPPGRAIQTAPRDMRTRAAPDVTSQTALPPGPTRNALLACRRTADRLVAVRLDGDRRAPLAQ